ncbi:M20/M25/M40 family metallo-hydrolase, partial [Streptomyces sp. NPDC005485]|uniref:M20/M25/M40 family metallo-hydrolase n=1 Tax=Streptomyces sp. NPDC005485 TaxID=3155591 RepID=UPI0033B54B8E
MRFLTTAGEPVQPPSARGSSGLFPVGTPNRPRARRSSMSTQRFPGSSAVIPETARFAATVRTFSDASHARVRAAFERTVHGVAAAHGVTADIDYVEQYPPTVNDADEAAFALETARQVLGADHVFEAPKPMAGAEDFSFVLRNVPGAFVG